MVFIKKLHLFYKGSFFNMRGSPILLWRPDVGPTIFMQQQCVMNKL